MSAARAASEPSPCGTMRSKPPCRAIERSTPSVVPAETASDAGIGARRRVNDLSPLGSMEGPRALGPSDARGAFLPAPARAAADRSRA